MIIKQNIQMQQLVDNNDINQLYPYTKAECVIVKDEGQLSQSAYINEKTDSAPVYLNTELNIIEDFISELEARLAEVIN